jgi:ubiquinol-cytochrome c reductase cytochrome b subunit
MKKSERIAGNVAGYVDDRTGAAKWLRKNLTKVFPDHWSFMLGEIVLYSFIILLLSGTFLTFWFDPSQREVIYEGSYEPLKDIKMSAAYASTLHISFDVRGGLLMRQIHRWNDCPLNARFLHRCIPQTSRS